MFAIKMENNEKLIKATDYSEGQKEAAFSVLGEIANLLAEYSDYLRIIGGWVPTLLFPDQDHIGSIDVDVLLNQQELQSAKGYKNIKQIMLKNGYRKHPDNYFSFVKEVCVQGVDYAVDVDFLSGKYGGKGGTISKHVEGIKALPATGGNFAFEFQPLRVTIEYKRQDGSLDYGRVNVISVVPYMVMKAAALGRGKPKDAYDIYYTVTHYPGGVVDLTKEFLPYANKKLVVDMCEKLKEKFASANHAGPADIVAFMGISEEEEILRVKQDAYQQIKYLVDSLQK